jgi:hypothetical protein
MSDDRHHPTQNAPATAHVARFAAALILLVGISLVGVAFDNRELALKRRISLETFRADHLESRAAELKLRIEQFQTPERLKAVLAGSAPPAVSK